MRYLTNQKAYRSHADLARLIRTAPEYRAIYTRAYRQTYARVVERGRMISALFDGQDCGLVEVYAKRDAKKAAFNKGIRMVIQKAEADASKPLGRSKLDLLSSSFRR